MITKDLVSIIIFNVGKFLNNSCSLKDVQCNLSSSKPIGAQIQDFTQRLDDLSITLQSLVCEKRENILSQASNAGLVVAEFNSVWNEAALIQEESSRIRQQIDAQYKTLEKQTRVLRRLHETLCILNS